MKYVFGPVFSRRLGMSLGVDPLPMKTCNWNCVYCQLGRTRPLTNERKDYFPPEEILKEVQDALKDRRGTKIDWISIVGSGEPLLVKSLGWLIQEIKKMTSIPVALITNGSLFYLPQVRREAALTDAVMPSIDAGSPETYRKINRSHPDVTYEKFISGLAEFRKGFKGRFWPEVMLIKGINDSPDELQHIADLLKNLDPDRVYLNVPVRPPAEKDICPPDQGTLKNAETIIGGSVKIFQTIEGTARHSIRCHGHARGLMQYLPVAWPLRPRATGKWPSAARSLDDKVSICDIIDMVSRHPLSEKELEELMEPLGRERARKMLGELKGNKSVKIVERNGVRFWCSGKAFFP